MDDKLIAAVVGAIAGIVGTYLGAILKYRKDLEFKYDTDLRDKRIPEYRDLWKLLQPLAKYARPKPVTGDELRELSHALRRWYFEGGGIYLSDKSRDAYFALQDSLKPIIEDPNRQHDTVLPEMTFEKIRTAGSDLRTSLTRDVGTRKEPKLN